MLPKEPSGMDWEMAQEEVKLNSSCNGCKLTRPAQLTPSQESCTWWSNWQTDTDNFCCWRSREETSVSCGTKGAAETWLILILDTPSKAAAQQKLKWPVCPRNISIESHAIPGFFHGGTQWYWCPHCLTHAPGIPITEFLQIPLLLLQENFRRIWSSLWFSASFLISE